MTAATTTEVPEGAKPMPARPATLRDLMTPPVGLFAPQTTVAQAVEQLREQVKSAFITYGYVLDPEGRLLGLVVMREMVLARPTDTLEAIMLKDLFTLDADMPLEEALRQALRKHFPVYPITDAGGKLVGLVRGEALFANRAIEISGQSGAMVGVDKEERVSTPVVRSLKLRHPWLQVNLLTAFLAAGVVSLFNGLISEISILAALLPVMAGQSGNTGCQALAVTLRGMTLGDIRPGGQFGMVMKEASLGFFNGLLVGATAGLGAFAYTALPHVPLAHDPAPIMVGVVVLIAMTIACTISGIAGALIPLGLKKAGADPATASSIFLTTASDVASMGIFLMLSSVML